MSLKVKLAGQEAKRTESASKSRRQLKKRITERYDLYIMLLFPMIWYVIFMYGPMYGLQIAFKDYLPTNGFWGSRWVGLEHFKRFFFSYYFWRLIKNTVVISVKGQLIQKVLIFYG